jgi:hypothetical protein
MPQLLMLSQAGTFDADTTKFDTLKHQILKIHTPAKFCSLSVISLACVLRFVLLSFFIVLVYLLNCRKQRLRRTSQPLIRSTVTRNRRISFSAVSEKFRNHSHNDDCKKSESPHWDDKLEALRAYRKSKRLCFTCGEKRNYAHKCPTQIPIHIMEELLEVLQSDEDEQYN